MSWVEKQMSAQILIVDDEEMIRNLLCQSLNHAGYSCHQACDVDEAFAVLGSQHIDLVLSDIMMPGRSGVELLKDIKETDPDISVLMITGLTDTKTALDCIHYGANDYIAKPFSVDRIVLTVSNLLDRRNLAMEKKHYQNMLEFKVFEKTEQLNRTMIDLKNAYNDTLAALVKALDAREKEVGSHSERVMNYAVLLGNKMGIRGNDLEHLAKGALLHDIGKIGVTDNILLKPGKLDPQEWEEMYRHPQIGYSILSEIDFLAKPAEIILSHHERFDGSGYPNRLKGNRIPIGARIFTLIDTLDAMTSDRPYRKALPFDKVSAEIIRCSGSQFDPEIADLFLSIHRAEWEECAGLTFL
jgi:putative two-component system response regulator